MLGVGGLFVYKLYSSHKVRIDDTIRAFFLDSSRLRPKEVEEKKEEQRHKLKEEVFTMTSRRLVDGQKLASHQLISL